MAITDISISEELTTNTPSIRYRGNEGPKSPKEMEMMMASVDKSFYKPEYADDHAMEMFGKPYEDLNADELEEFMEEMRRLMNKFSGGQPLPEDPTKPVNPFGPKPTGPVLPDKRETAAYGGIMGVDGRKQYGIGSFFQKLKDKVVDDLIPNEIKENPLAAAAAIAAGDQLITGGEGRRKLLEGLGGIKDYVLGGEEVYKTSEGDEVIRKKPGALKRILDIDVGDDKTLGSTVSSMIAKNILPIAGGITAGLFTKNQPDTAGLPSDDTALQLADLKKSANLLTQPQGLAAGLNFLPDVAARKFTPEEMAIQYAQTAANGGRIGFNQGLLAGPTPKKQMDPITIDVNEDIKLYDVYDGKPIIKNYYSKEESGRRNEAFFEIINPMTGGISTISEVDFYKKYGKPNAYGGRIGKAEGGIMDLGGKEKDYRNTGGFVDLGAKEKADDVPARLSVNEFVFTADAVRNAGGGDVDEGAKVMENMMKHLEGGGQISRESQGMGGARDMFAVSERLSEVV